MSRSRKVISTWDFKIHRLRLMVSFVRRPVFLLWYDPIKFIDFSWSDMYKIICIWYHFWHRYHYHRQIICDQTTPPFGDMPRNLPVIVIISYQVLSPLRRAGVPCPRDKHLIWSDSSPQGAELRILSGTKRSLARTKYIFFINGT